jgi:hypothetical protein
MLSNVMDIHGQCLLDYLNGEKEAFCMLHIDPETLKQYVEKSGMYFRMIASGENQRHLCRIKKRRENETK